MTVVSVAGDVDLASMDQFARALHMHLRDGAGTVVIDLAEVGFISSAGGRVLVATVREARQRGVIVRLESGQAVRRVIALLGALADDMPDVMVEGPARSRDRGHE